MFRQTLLCGDDTGKEPKGSFISSKESSTKSLRRAGLMRICFCNGPSKIKKLFPSAVQNERIQRQVLADIVFKDKQALETLNAVAHPLIMERLYENMRNCTDILAFAEVPLLFEGNYQSQFDAVIVVQRSKEQRISAIVARDGLTREEAVQRISAQFDYDSPTAQKLFSNPNIFLLPNEGTEMQLKRDLKKILKYISS